MAYFKYQAKNINYKETGNGPPVIFLHGNTASSKMFELLLPLYQGQLHVILLDFLGNGKSDRIKKFSDDIWFDEALQTIALIEHLEYDKVSLVGTSGGAWAAMNAALERPDLIQSVVADSFDGRTLHPDFWINLRKERQFAMQDEEASQFYAWCQGADWKTVVDLDTQALLKYENSRSPLFHKPLATLSSTLLLMGSKQDNMVRDNLIEEYREILAEINNGRMHIFETGGHPAILTNAEAAAQIICDFLT